MVFLTVKLEIGSHTLLSIPYFDKMRLLILGFLSIKIMQTLLMRRV